MKKTSLLLFIAALMLSSCGIAAQWGSSENNQRFQDGIYSNSPSFRSKEEKDKSKTETDALIKKTKESAIYLLGEQKDTIMIPENFSARIQYDQKVGGTVVTVGENPYDWRWDLENRYGYYYGPYSLGSSWWWSRHYSPFYGPYRSPYWSSWHHYPCGMYGYYDPWYYRDPWYYGGMYGYYDYYGFYGPWGYDPWYYGGYYGNYYTGYWGGYYGGWYGWHDPWHYYHYGWYHPHHIHGPSHVGGSHFETRNYGLRANTERTRPMAGVSTGHTSRPEMRTSGGTMRGGMSIGNTRSRSTSTARRPSGSVSRPATATRPASVSRSGSSSSQTTYRRPASSQQTKSTSEYDRSSTPSYNRGSSPYERSSSSYNRSSSSDFGGSSSSGGYSRGSHSSGGGSSYSRGGSSGGYRR